MQGELGITKVDGNRFFRTFTAHLLPDEKAHGHLNLIGW
jgi:hypothetical protein